MLKQEVEDRKRRLEMHRKLAAKQDRTVEQLQREIRKKNSDWSALAIRTAEARSFLCREAAGLCSLWQKRRHDCYQYIIGGGVQIPHLLQDLNGRSFWTTRNVEVLTYFFLESPGNRND